MDELWTEAKNSDLFTVDQRSLATSTPTSEFATKDYVSSIAGNHKKLEQKRNNSSESDQCKPYSLSPEARSVAKLKTNISNPKKSPMTVIANLNVLFCLENKSSIEIPNGNSKS